MKTTCAALPFLVPLCLATLASFAAAARDPVIAPWPDPAPRLAFTGATWQAHAPVIRDWLAAAHPGFDTHAPAAQALVELLARWTHRDKTGAWSLSAKYGNLFIEAYNRCAQLSGRLAESPLPPEAQDAWRRYHAERMIGNRLLLDVGMESRRIAALPAGGQVVVVGDGRAAMTALAKAYPEWPRLPGPRQAAALRALARINPLMRNAGFLRLAPGASSDDEPGLHAVVPMADGRRQIERWSLPTGTALYLPPAAWLTAETADIRDAPLPAEPPATPPPFQRVRLRLPGAAAGLDVVLQLAFLEGELDNGAATLPSLRNRVWPVFPWDPESGAPAAGSLDTALLHPLRRDGARLRGLARVTLKLDTGDPQPCLIALDGTDGEAGGVFVMLAGRTPPVRGRFQPEPDPAPAPFAPEAHWTLWCGSRGDGAAVGGAAAALVESLDEAALVWAADDDMPDGRGPDTRGSARAIPAGEPLSGTYCTPVVARGKVVVTAYEPSGDVLSYGAETKNDPARYRINKILADDIVQAFDAATGRTAWRRVYAGTGVNWAGFNKGGPKLSAAIAGGLAIAVGTTGRIRALDLDTGATVWETDIGPRHDQMEQARRELVGARELLSTRNDFMFDPMVADGVVAVSDARKTKMDYRYEYANGTVAFDAATGRRLWHLPEIGSDSRFNQGVLVCRIAGQDFFLATGGGLRLIEPRTGRVRWHLPGATLREEHLGFCGDIVLADETTPEAMSEDQDEQQAGLLGVRVTPDRAEIVWRTREVAGMVGGAVAVNGRFFLTATHPEQGLYCLDAATGARLAAAPLPIARGEHCPFIVETGGRVIFCSDRTDGYYLATADPAVMAASAAYWPAGSVAADLATGYCGPILPALVDGRMFMRARNRVLCYDLRAGKAPPREHASRWARSAPPRPAATEATGKAAPAKPAPAKPAPARAPAAKPPPASKAPDPFSFDNGLRLSE